MTRPVYPEYKDSGNQWLGEIPGALVSMATQTHP